MESNTSTANAFNATPHELEYDLRRVRSTGDLPDDDIPRRYIRSHQRSGTIGNASALGYGHRNSAYTSSGNGQGQGSILPRTSSSDVLSIQQLYSQARSPTSNPTSSRQPSRSGSGSTSPRPSLSMPCPFSRGEDTDPPRPPQVLLRPGGERGVYEVDELMLIRAFEREHEEWENGRRAVGAGGNARANRDRLGTRAEGNAARGGDNGGGGNGNGNGNRNGEVREPRNWWERLMFFLGRSGPNAKLRSRLVSMVWAFSFGSIQFIVIVTLLALSAHSESPTRPGQNQWDACDKPLGVWNALWLGRVMMGCLIAYYEWRTEHRLYQARQSATDAESRGRTPVPNARSPGLAVTLGGPGGASVGVERPANVEGNADASNQNEGGDGQTPRFLSRLSLLSSMLSLVWFLTAHVFEYSSVSSCRLAAPYIWWLTFGILCILYAMIVEIFLIGLLVFILGPVLYLLYNIVLLCLGRHPLQNPHYIKPEIGKLSKSIVDQIPLVFYIPAPEDPNSSTSLTSLKGASVGKDKEVTAMSSSSPLTVPEAAYSYPPKPPAPAPPQRKKRFAFLSLRKRSSGDGSNDKEKKLDGKGKDKEKGGRDGETKTWEDNWVKGEYPFVRLEGNRAACAICLMDFEEPERVHGSQQDSGAKETAESIKEKVEANTRKSKEGKGEKGDGEAGETRVRVEEATREQEEKLKLEEAGEGAQPLRLLACGHCFHQTCIDPWLTNVSGRCPTCQRPVEIPEEGKAKKRRGT